MPAIAECPRYAPDQETGVQQKSDGTARHKVLERVLLGEREALQDLPERDADGVAWAADYIRAFAEALGEPVETERTVAFFGPHLEPVRGTLDARVGHNIFDLKWRDDFADYSLQLACYALAVCEEYGFDAVEAHTLYAFSKKVERKPWTRGQAQRVLFPIIRAADDEESRPRVNPYCDICAHRVSCKTLRAEVEKIEALPEPESFTTPEDLGKGLRLARRAKAWADAFIAHATKAAQQQGIEPEGFKLVGRRGKREIVSITKAFPLCGLPQEAFLEACKVDFSDLVKTYAAFHGTKLRPAEEELEQKLATVINRKPTIYYLKEN